jgi:hypothetical protein
VLYEFLGSDASLVRTLADDIVITDMALDRDDSLLILDGPGRRLFDLQIFLSLRGSRQTRRGARRDTAQVSCNWPIVAHAGTARRLHRRAQMLDLIGFNSNSRAFHGAHADCFAGAHDHL